MRISDWSSDGCSSDLPWQWPRLAWRLLRGLRPEEPTRAADIAVIRDWPEPKEFRRQSTNLLSRGVRILAMYTGGVSKYMMDRRQLDDTFGDRKSTRLNSSH